MEKFNLHKIASRWSNTSIESLLSSAARGISAGNATDAGRMWRLPTEHPDPIVLAGGVPDETFMPLEKIIDGLTKAIKEEAEESLMYGGWFGYQRCREAIANRQNDIEGISLTADNIIMHNGSSGCLENILKAFLQPGDVSIIESPSYSGTVRAIQGYEADVVDIPMGENGINPSVFENTVAKIQASGRMVKMFYTIPDYHNPMGYVTSLETRQDILNICSKNGILIAEDAAYTELYFDAPPPPSYYALSDGHGVIKMCSFSKIVATGLRSGWIQARAEFTEPLTRVRFDMGNSPLVHYALADLILSGELDNHVDAMRSLYKNKCQALIKSLRQYCDPYIEVVEPEGGYFLWVKCKQGNALDVTHAAAAEGLVFPSGSVFYLDRDQNTTHIRLAYTRAPFEQLEESGKRLQRAFEKVLD
tara:strand:+ start:92 stop:1348 length:1257 start_codon:yes stop_codon:yes gene_type:complete